MPDTGNEPVIFLAFANDRDDTVGYLRNLPDEARRLRDVLDHAELAGLCEVVVRSNSTAGDIFKVFQDPKYRNRVAIFHFGGHANGYQLLLESPEGKAAVADAGGLAAFLAEQQGLQLVFLNGCSTQQQTQSLHDANIPIVISTSRSIDDKVATDFAWQFYQGLAGGATLRKAYSEASAAIKTPKGEDLRALYYGDADKPEDHRNESGFPWNLYPREGSETADQWNLPEAVNDPLFGLPPLPEQDLPESPYRHLNWFRREDAEVFFGRGHQIRKLYGLLTAGTQSIILFYGQSGVGKSSLLDAGLIPRLEQSCEVRYLRRRPSGLLDTLQLAFLPEASDVPIETAWLAKEKQLKKPLIVFLDQVEEFYTQPIVDLPDELDQLLRVIKATFGDPKRRPKGKLVLGFRKEWLAEVEAQMVAYELPRAKVSLKTLDRAGIIEVVQGPTRSVRLQERYGLKVEDGLAEMIADDMLKDRGSAISTTLQILLSKMWTEAISANSESLDFTKDLYLTLESKGILLGDFFNQQLEEFKSDLPTAADSGLLLDVLALHTTDLGSANECSHARLLKEYDHVSDLLPSLLRKCQDLYLLTEATSNQKTSLGATRLAHDTLAPLVRDKFDKSDKPGQRARRILDNRSIDWKDGQQNATLGEADLNIVEQGRSGTRVLNATELRLLAASHKLLQKEYWNRKFRWIAIVSTMAVLVLASGLVWYSTKAAAVVENLLRADTSEIKKIIEEDLPFYRWWIEGDLRREFADSAGDSNPKLHVGLALASNEQKTVPQVMDFLRDRFLTVTPTQLSFVRDLLKNRMDELNGAYWKIANDETKPAPLRFHAACALAEYDSANRDWSEPAFAEFVAEQLVSVNPEYIGQYKELIRPVSAHLVPSLSNIFKDPSRVEVTRTLATFLLSDYAAGDYDTLVNLILAADVGSDQKLFPLLQKHQTAAVNKLEGVLEENLRPDWHDQPLDAAWSDISPSASANIEAAHGMITKRFAFCQDMAWEQFLEVVELLRASGYRPIRVRPWRRADQVLAAAIWTRDNQTWELESGVKKSDLPTADSPATRDDLMIADIAELPSGDQSADRSFIALWSQPTTDKEQRRLVVGVTESELVATNNELIEQGFRSQCTINVWATADGQRHYAGIWSNQGAPSELKPAYAGFEKVHQPQWDVTVAAAGELADPLEQIRQKPKYAALWRADEKFESRLLTTIAVEETLDQSKLLIAEDFRPVAVTVDGAGATSLVFHRPLTPDPVKEELAIRQAAAVTTLLRMNLPEHVWPLFRHQPDPRLCSYLLNRLVPYGVDPQLLLAQLQIEEDVSIRRALIIGIGEFARDGSLSTEQQAFAIKDLVNRYGEDPDLGVHGASEWALRQMGAVEEIIKVRKKYAKGTAVGRRKWYMTKTGGLSMAIIHPEDEFLMSSPISEVGRHGGPTGGGPTGQVELLHRRSIGRVFAIGAHEITVEQFRAFSHDHRFGRAAAREEDAPANMVTWYDAAKFCNWLSDQEGIPKDQWCYDPDQQFTEGMTLPPNYLQRKGYRLPTESEWEYACRAGTSTSRYFGETETLLGEYAWYIELSRRRYLLPVGSLRPNGVGLFDMLGNAYEWCQEEASIWETDREQMGDNEQLRKLNNSNHRVLRGGSLMSYAQSARSAKRYFYNPDTQTFEFGFRVARTYD